MRYNIYHNGEYVNAIEASEEFTQKYCEKNGYTYEEIPVEPAPTPEPTPEPTVWDELAAAYQEGVNSIDK